MIQKIKDWTWFILAGIGLIAIYEFLRRSNTDVTIEDISDQIKQKEDLLKQLDNVQNTDLNETEILEWLNKK